MAEDKVINPQKVYNVQEAAKVLDINEQTLLDYLRRRKIAAQKIGEWKILGKNLIDFLSNKTYIVVTKQGVHGKVNARSQEELFHKLATGHYGVMHTKGNLIKYTPENIKEIIELVDEKDE